MVEKKGRKLTGKQIYARRKARAFEKWGMPEARHRTLEQYRRWIMENVPDARSHIDTWEKVRRIAELRGYNNLRETWKEQKQATIAAQNGNPEIGRRRFFSRRREARLAEQGYMFADTDFLYYYGGGKK